MRSGWRGGHRLLDLENGSRVEARAQPREQIEDFGRRVGFDRVETRVSGNALAKL